MSTYSWNKDHQSRRCIDWLNTLYNTSDYGKMKFMKDKSDFSSSVWWMNSLWHHYNPRFSKRGLRQVPAWHLLEGRGVVPGREDHEHFHCTLRGTRAAQHGVRLDSSAWSWQTSPWGRAPWLPGFALCPTSYGSCRRQWHRNRTPTHSSLVGLLPPAQPCCAYIANKVCWIPLPTLSNKCLPAAIWSTREYDMG